MPLFFLEESYWKLVGGITGLMLLLWVPALVFFNFHFLKLFIPSLRGAEVTDSAVSRGEIFFAFRTILVDGLAFGVMVHFQVFDYVPTQQNIVWHLIAIFMLFFWGEAFFYLVHRMIHWSPLYFIHRVHHRAQVPNSFTGYSFSILERVVHHLYSWVYIWPLAKIIPITAVDAAVYVFVVNMYSIVEHTNIRLLPYWWNRRMILKYFIDPTYHAIHHKDQSKNFGLCLNLFDRLLGTYKRELGLEELGKTNP